MKKNSWNGTIQTITKNEEIRYRFSFFFILIVGLVIISGYNPFEKHIRSDGAYFMYMGQAICRGELIYRDMTCGYSPMVPLINAAFITMGRWFSVPSFVSPKLFAVIILLGSYLLLFLVIKNYFRKNWLGILAALMLMDFLLAEKQNRHISVV